MTVYRSNVLFNVYDIQQIFSDKNIEYTEKEVGHNPTTMELVEHYCKIHNVKLVIQEHPSDDFQMPLFTD